MKKVRFVTVSGIIAGCLAIAGIVPAQAQSNGEFYAGRTVTLVVAASAGGGYGLYASMIAEHMGHHVPGHPALVPQYMPGAGGAKAANFVYNAAPKDGTSLGVLLSPMPLAQFVGKGTKYDATKFQYIGRVADVVEVMNVRKDAPATTIDGMKKTQIVLGATGPFSDTAVMPIAMNKFVGTRFKIITGYSGQAPIMLAVERKEVHGMVGTLGVVISRFPKLLDGSFAVQPVQFGLERDPRIKDVPTLTDLVEGKTEKQLAEFIVAPTALGRYLVAPPGVPADRVAMLRKAFDATMADPSFRATLKKRHSDFKPMSGENLQALVKRIASTPAPVIEMARSLFGAK